MKGYIVLLVLIFSQYLFSAPINENKTCVAPANDVKSTQISNTPVSLASFAAYQQGDDIVLEWTIENRPNVAGFILQRYKADSSTFYSWSTITSSKTNDGLKFTGAEPHTFSYTDKDAAIAATTYRIGEIGANGDVMFTDLIRISLDNCQQNDMRLQPAEQNLTNSESTIVYTLKQEAQIDLKITNIKGDKIRQIIGNASQSAGFHMTKWNGIGDDGRIMPNGVYMVALRSGQQVETQKILLFR
jgi:hypothetical protein